MESKDIREGFLKFFESKNHLRLKSSSLIPKDPTLLFTGAGMVPLKAYFLQEETPPSLRITTVQKCVRTNDIEQVGFTPRHHTFFEMLGNFSIGDYFKEEAIAWALEFSTKNLGLPLEKLWVTIYKDDAEAKEIWKKVGISEERIIPLGEEDNFWTMGPVGPCGPCSEIYFDRGANSKEEEIDLPGGKTSRFLEFWNLVFTQFDKQLDGSLIPLPKKNIDTGMGLERITSIIEGVESDFDTDLFIPIIRELEKISKVNYKENENRDRAFKTISDHIRAITFLIADGVIPSNEKRGYVLRRLIRRSAVFGRNIGLNEPFLYKIAHVVSETLGDIYPEVVQGLPLAEKILKEEEKRFEGTLRIGFDYFNEKKEKLIKDGSTEFPARDIFYLYDTLGLPVEITEMLINESGFNFNKEEFNILLEEQREKARYFFKGGESFTERVSFVEIKNTVQETQFLGYDTLDTNSVVKGIVKDGNLVEEARENEEVLLILDKTPFYPEKGGQVGDKGKITGENFEFEVEDTQTPVEGLIIHIGKVIKGNVKPLMEVKASVDKERRKAIMRAHTCTHILQSALRKYFGETISQQGSEVKPDEFRFDFNFNETFEKEHLFEIERIVNEIILENLLVTKTEMSKEEAKSRGALAFFGEKYGNRVRVIEVQGKSIELCGGTHIDNTSEIGIAILIGVRSVASGVKRIEALTGKKAYEYLLNERKNLIEVQKIINATEDSMFIKLKDLITEFKDSKKEISELKREMLKNSVKSLSKLLDFEGQPIFAIKVQGFSFNELKDFYDTIKSTQKEGAIILLSETPERTYIVIGSLSLSFPNQKFSNILKEKLNLKGGGSSKLFQGSTELKVSIEDVVKAFEG